MSKLSIPPYILHADVENKPVAYGWRGTADFVRENEKLEEKLITLSVRARLACATAMAEWVFWRLQGETDFEAPLQMIEAAWAANCDVRYCQTPTVAEFQDRKGPVNGVLRASKDILADILRGYKAESAASVTSRAVYMYFLARHVMPDTAPFDAWLKAIIKRLALLYPHVEEQLGEPVPREAVNTEAEFQKENAPQLLADFLGGLVPSENRYLRSPEQMLADGFTDTPYRIS